MQYLKHHLELTETVSAAGGTDYTNHDIINNGTTDVVYTNVVEAFAGNKVAGDVLQVWNYGNINGAHHDTRVTDITLALGYNFVNSENGHFGVEVGGLFGAGKKSQAKHVFEPTFGNLGRMGIFGAVDGHAVLWNGEDDKQLAAYINGNVGYIFANHQRRSYDLTNFGKWSRYLLVKKVSSVSATTTNSVYAGVDNMINIGTLEAKIGDYVNFDASLLFDYQYNNFDFQLGYNLGGHTKEKHKGFVDTIAANTYMVHVPGLAGAQIDLAIGASGDASTVSGATNIADNFSINGDITTVVPTVAELITANTTSVAIANSWLDTDSALAKTAIAHAVVGAMNYTWRDNDYTPCLGIYGKAEFDGNNHNTADLWAVGVQGNVSF